MTGHHRGMEVGIRRARLADIDPASVVLGEAFADYAWTRWTVDPDDHVRRVTELQRLALRSVGFAFGRVWVGTAGGVITSVAVWMDSHVVVPPEVHEDTHLVTAGLEGCRHEASVAAQREVEGWRPKPRHYYLAVVGTAPAMQGRGLATAVLRPGLAAADAENLCAFLETSSASNLAFYGRLGFEATDHRRISGGGPDVWAMLRQPLQLTSPTAVEAPSAPERLK